MQINIQQAGKNNKRIELHQNPFLLEKGQKLTYAMWAKAEDARPAKMIAIIALPPGQPTGTKTLQLVRSGKSFTQKSK